MPNVGKNSIINWIREGRAICDALLQINVRFLAGSCSGKYNEEDGLAMQKKFVYLFKEGNATMREILGGKGANLAEMTNIGLPVPQGFTITTEACTQ